MLVELQSGTLKRKLQKKLLIVTKVLEYIFDIFCIDNYIMTEDRSKNSSFPGRLQIVAVKMSVVKCKLPMLS